MNGITVVFRVDASTEIGTGHVMRCLALAQALSESGARCHFVCRQHSGHLGARVSAAGHDLLLLPAGDAPASPDVSTSHAGWLGAGWREDAEQTVAAMADRRWDWLVVDHYALDARWEQTVRSRCGRVLAIDDLADRAHDCDLLLDQNLGRAPADYAGRVPKHCRLLAGPKYALLRPEFTALRETSLQRRKQPELRRLLITMGGVDRDNTTALVLAALRDATLPKLGGISVVMGSGAPWLNDVRAASVHMPWPTQVQVDVQDMARLMAECDLAIGGAGSTSWERCCLGVPSIAVVMAANQREAATALAARGAAIVLERDDVPRRLPDMLTELARGEGLAKLSVEARDLVDGLGTMRVTEALRDLQ